MSELYKSRALVLFRRVYKENDEILGLFTPEYGRLDVVVRGSKKFKSHWVGKLEPFVEINGLLARGQAYSYLVQAEVVRAYRGLLADYDRLCWGSFLLDLWAACSTPAALDEEGSLALDESDTFLPLYEALLEALATLERARSLPLAGCWAEWKLLRLLGHELCCSRCVNCGNLDLIGISYVDGGLVCSDCWSKLGGSDLRQAKKLNNRILTMVSHLPRLTATKAAEIVLSPNEARQLEEIVWCHWRACGLPWLKARRLIEITGD